MEIQHQEGIENYCKPFPHSEESNKTSRKKRIKGPIMSSWRSIAGVPIARSAEGAQAI